MDECVHGPNRFFDGRIGIGPMTEIKVEIVDAESTEGSVAGLDDVFLAEAGLIGLVATPEHFG